MPLGMGFRRGWNDLGSSRQGMPIRAYANFTGSVPVEDWTLMVGGTHGDERATVPFLENFIQEVAANANGLGRMAVIPLLNPDGYAMASRYNSTGVDLNRNFPAHWSPDSEEPPGPGPLSEPEARLLHDLIGELRPRRIVTLHWALSELDAVGKGRELAQGMWENLGENHRKLFRLNLDSEPSLPGSLGTHCAALDWETALVTVELPYHPEPEFDPLPENHLDTVQALWREEKNRY